ncbi:MAG: CDP-alcohol phosphatidyltransferase family protein [Bacteroidota bacterium]|nr:CDP-alcohol phosphatidyltransferase family protein [Bacteroidota bacterium]
MKKQIPNVFTLLNLFFGCMAVVFALQTNELVIYLNQDYNSSFNIPEKLTWAAICIGIAALIDFLDGFLARALKATSPLGKELDSLCDIVSFGVAPGALLYQLLRLSFARQENGLDVGLIWLLPAFILTCAAAYRLAKFNIDPSQSHVFRGVPVPAVGLLVASFPLILHFNTLPGVSGFLVNKWFLYGLIAVLSWLMISRIPMLSLKFTTLKFRPNAPQYMLVLIALVGAFLLHWLAAPVVFVFYILFSLFTPNKTS